MKDLLKFNSVQVMALWSVIGGIIVAMWPVAHWAIDTILPDTPAWRIPFAVLVSGITFGSYVYARCRPQPKLTGNG